jgi:hypothetical protein
VSATWLARARRSWLAPAWSWWRGIRAPKVRFVRRVEIHCPHGRGLVTVDVVTDPHGRPDVVLRCSAHASCPPACDQACLRCAEAVRTPATALLVLPTPHGPDDSAD